MDFLITSKSQNYLYIFKKPTIWDQRRVDSIYDFRSPAKAAREEIALKSTKLPSINFYGIHEAKNGHLAVNLISKPTFYHHHVWTICYLTDLTVSNTAQESTQKRKVARDKRRHTNLQVTRKEICKRALQSATLPQMNITKHIPTYCTTSASK